LQIHGSLGLTDQMPFTSMIMTSYHMGLADGPTEVHKVTVAREVLKDVKPAEGAFPDYMLFEKVEAAREKFGDALEAAEGR
jgi:acyl-CoA dehydrogenase